MEVRQIVEDGRGEFVFGVVLPENNKYVTWFSRDYYQKLTGGKISAEELVKKSFEFLLAHESSSSILPEFNLSVIAHYFSDYETLISAQQAR
jgi:hypothetical protein